MADLLSYLGVTPHLKTLNFCGFYQLDSNSSKMKKLLHTAYMRFILCLILLYTLQQILKVYQDRDDLNKVMNTVFLLLTNSDAIYKQIVLWKRANRIEVLLNILKGPIFNQKKQEHQEFLLAAARESRLLLRGFNIAALATCLLWVLYPVILYVQRKHVEFAIWLPFDANLSPQFYFAAFYVWVQTSWLALSNTTQDVFITYFLVQCRTQLSILRLDLEHIVQKSKEEAAKTSEDFKSILERRLKIVLLHYSEIVKFSALIQEIFGGAVMYFFLVGGWIICTTAYKTVNVHPASVEFLSMTMYMACILVELFMYCYYGNEVTYEVDLALGIFYQYIPRRHVFLIILCCVANSAMGIRSYVIRLAIHRQNLWKEFWYKSEKVIESAYALDWLAMPLKSKRDMIIFMERIKRNVNIVAGNLVPLSNGTFVSLVRSSYTFYAFLKNTTN